MPNEFNIENGGMLVNDALLADADITALPTTWPDLVAAAKQLVRVRRGGKLTQVGFGFKDSDPVNFLLYSMILQQGATYWADDGVHVNLQTDAAQESLRRHDGRWSPRTRSTASTAYAGRGLSSSSSKGKAAMAMRGPWVIPEAEAFPDLEFSYVADAAVRRDGAEVSPPSRAGARSSTRGAAPEIKDAAWSFIDFMHEPDNLRDWNITTYTLPSLQRTRRTTRRSWRRPRRWATSFAVLPYGQWIGPVHNRDRFFQSITDAFTSVALGQLDAATALDAGRAEDQRHDRRDDRPVSRWRSPATLPPFRDPRGTRHSRWRRAARGRPPGYAARCASSPAGAASRSWPCSSSSPCCRWRSALWLSFHRYNQLAPDAPFIGLRNFEFAFSEDPFFRNALGNTLKYALVAVPLNLVIALPIALGLNQVTRFGRSFAPRSSCRRSASAVAVSLIWHYIYDPQAGWLNAVLEADWPARARPG